MIKRQRHSELFERKKNEQAQEMQKQELELRKQQLELSQRSKITSCR